MSGSLGMDMNGADASAAAGLNTTKVNRHYTGPPSLRTSLGSCWPTATMGPPPRSTWPRAAGAAVSVSALRADRRPAVRAGDERRGGPHRQPLRGRAAGYVAAPPMDYPVVYYVNPTVVAANAAAAHARPGQHAGTASSSPRRRQAGDPGRCHVHLAGRLKKAPMPYGALRRHQRTAVCGFPGADRRCPVRHHRIPIVRRRLDADAHALRDNGLAGPGGRRTTGHSAARYSDRRGAIMARTARSAQRGAMASALGQHSRRRPGCGRHVGVDLLRLGGACDPSPRPPAGGRATRRRRAPARCGLDASSLSAATWLMRVPRSSRPWPDRPRPPCPLRGRGSAREYFAGEQAAGRREVREERAMPERLHSGSTLDSGSRCNRLYRFCTLTNSGPPSGTAAAASTSMGAPVGAPGTPGSSLRDQLPSAPHRLGDRCSGVGRAVGTGRCDRCRAWKGCPPPRCGCSRRTPSLVALVGHAELVANTISSPHRARHRDTSRSSSPRKCRRCRGA